MAVKYRCTKCGRRFVEWGAEKLSFMCPCAEKAVLVPVTGAEDRPSRRPTIRRTVGTVTRSHAAVAADTDQGGQDSDFETEEEEPIEEIEVGTTSRAVKGSDEAQDFTLDSEDTESLDDGSEDVEEDVAEELSLGEAGPPAESRVPDTFEADEGDWRG